MVHIMASHEFLGAAAGSIERGTADLQVAAVANQSIFEITWDFALFWK